MGDGQGLNIDRGEAFGGAIDHLWEVEVAANWQGKEAEVTKDQGFTEDQGRGG